MDKTDITISAIAGIVGAAVDLLLVGIPEKGPDGLEAGPLSDLIRKKLMRLFKKPKWEYMLFLKKVRSRLMLRIIETQQNMLMVCQHIIIDCYR